jgi:hypothetical protein
MNGQTKFDADPELDQLLVHWRQQLDGNDSQLQRMQDIVTRQLAGGKFEGESLVLPSQRRAISAVPQRRPLIALVAVVMCLALTVGLFDSAPKGVTVHHSLALDEQVSFTAAEIRRQEELVCELDRVFEHQLVGVHLRGEKVSVDVTDESLATDGAPRLLMRFVLQQRVGNGNWSTVTQEEVIGPQDNQFGLLDDSRHEVGYWSHLLPDHSLWMESTITQPGGGIVRCTGQYQLNHPAEVWTQSSEGRQRRMLVVYELLNPCARGVI